MKTRLLIIGIISLVVLSSFILNYYIEEEIKTKKFNEEHIARIFKLCDYQEMMNERNWIGFDGNYITDDQTLLVPATNSTHSLGNITCKWELKNEN